MGLPRRLCVSADVKLTHRGGQNSTGVDSYEPIGQTVSGLAIAEGTAEQPVLACTFTLNDYLTAYLAAAGVVGALIKRSAGGGSYHVTASLTRTSMWVQELGRLPEQLWPGQSGGVSELPPIPEEYFQETESVFGTLRHPRPIVRYGETQAKWALPPSPPGSRIPVW